MNIRISQTAISAFLAATLAGPALAETIELTCYERHTEPEPVGTTTKKGGWLEIDLAERAIRFTSMSRQRYEPQGLMWGENQITWQYSDQSQYSVIFFGFHKDGLLTAIHVDMDDQRVRQEFFICNQSDAFRFGFVD
jgi:hypothetical protein